MAGEHLEHPGLSTVLLEEPPRIAVRSSWKLRLNSDTTHLRPFDLKDRYPTSCSFGIACVQGDDCLTSVDLDIHYSFSIEKCYNFPLVPIMYVCHVCVYVSVK